MWVVRNGEWVIIADDACKYMATSRLYNFIRSVQQSDRKSRARLAKERRRLWQWTELGHHDGCESRY